MNASNDNRKNSHIVVVVKDLILGGAERISLNLAKGFMSRGFDVHLVVLENTIEFPNIDVPVHRFRPCHFARRLLTTRLWRQINAVRLELFILMVCKFRKPALVLSNSPDADQFCASMNLNVYLVVHNTVSISWMNVGSIAPNYEKKPAICVSRGVMEDFLRTFPFAKSARCIYNPVNVDEVEKGSRENSLLDLEDYIIHIARFSVQKRHDVLLHAYHRARASPCRPWCWLVTSASWVRSGLSTQENWWSNLNLTIG